MNVSMLMTRKKEYFLTYVVRWIRSRDTSIIEFISGLGGIFYVILCSDHELNVLLTFNRDVETNIFLICLLFISVMQIKAASLGNIALRYIIAMCIGSFWLILSWVAFTHPINAHLGFEGHPGSAAAFFSLAFGNMLAYLRLQD